MEFKIDRDVFLKSLAHVQGVVEKKNTWAEAPRNWNGTSTTCCKYGKPFKMRNKTNRHPRCFTKKIVRFCELSATTWEQTSARCWLKAKKPLRRHRPSSHRSCRTTRQKLRRIATQSPFSVVIRSRVKSKPPLSIRSSFLPGVASSSIPPRP